MGGSTNYYAHSDAIGNVRALTDGNGAVRRTYNYDEWGQLYTNSSDGLPFNGADRARWKGALWMGPELDLYYMRNRWYEPRTGRFLSEDPIGLAGGINQYAFAGGDPINGADPIGLSPGECELYWLRSTHYTQRNAETGTVEQEWDAYAPLHLCGQGNGGRSRGNSVKGGGGGGGGACWPISDQCKEEPLSDGQSRRVNEAISTINAGARTVCREIQSRLRGAFGEGRIRLWTVGPPGYDPASFSGDSHRGPGIVHVTNRAFRNGLELRVTLVEEMAHQMDYSHGPELNQVLTDCAGGL